MEYWSVFAVKEREKERERENFLGFLPTRRFCLLALCYPGLPQLWTVICCCYKVGREFPNVLHFVWVGESDATCVLLIVN